jgi:diguanylate cyclase (GGDEF)-like protein
MSRPQIAWANPMKLSRSGKSHVGPLARPASRRALEAERLAAESDQSASDADQTASDADETASEQDAADAASDQQAAEQDQANADRQHRDADEAGIQAYEASRSAREATMVHRLFTKVTRTGTARSRLATAANRDASASRRDEAARRRDLRAADLDRSIAAADVPLSEKLRRILDRAAAARDRAAADRARATQDRADAAAERARLEAELSSAHLDDLTGAFRRETGRLALRHEIDRAMRADGRFVIAFVDVDWMKAVNDQDGHAAGDHVLKTVVWTMRSKLRSFDPVVRYGGDEFVCGIGGVELDEVGRRFDAIGRSVESAVGVTISVGLAKLEPNETLDQLTARADAALLDAKKRRGE